ncbi:hypothetical protein CMV_006857 [Castanea mollissima]|uniref:Uncharacterized protein n=1 Tax=Castanea mollissima TaxID=60419 RepID=A0A8J4RNC4_9ROSI|nr:hypothetical protein CMV_006857 [Castanea mollissima]
MGRRKANLRTRSKSLTLERAYSQDVDEVGDQETHEASIKDMSLLLNSLPFIRKVWTYVQPAVRDTRGPSKYLDVWDFPDDEEIELPLNSLH